MILNTEQIKIITGLTYTFRIGASVKIQDRQAARADRKGIYPHPVARGDPAYPGNVAALF